MKRNREQEKSRFSETEQMEAGWKQPVTKSNHAERLENGKHSKGKEILSFLWPMAVAFVAALAVSNLVLINAVIPSESMQNLLQKKDRLFGFRLAYVLEDPQRYDVVMFHYPVDEDTIYIKRIIGLPGETVEIRDGGIYIDGAQEPLREDYLPETWVNGNDGFLFEVPKECYLMLGDNRNISEDARYWAQCAVDKGVAANLTDAEPYTYVQKDKIIGRAIFKYYPYFHSFLNI